MNIRMSKLIIKATDKKLGLVKGTGPGCVRCSFIAARFSKEFVLKEGTFLHLYDVIDAKVGDNVVFAYAE